MKLLNEFLIDQTRDIPSKPNKIINRTKGIIICDTYNNPFFPIDTIRIDNADSNLNKVFNRYKQLYATDKSVYLPCHYCIELIEYNYVVYNTRPLNLKFPIVKSELEEHNWDNITKQFIKLPNELTEYIHVWVIGDSNSDMYSKKFYNCLATMCIEPILFNNKQSKTLIDNVFPLNMGINFKMNKMSNLLT